MVEKEVEKVLEYTYLLYKAYKDKSIINIVLKTKYIGLNRYLTLAYLYSYN